MAELIVVVGTDTGVGKTVVAAGLARAFAAAGRRTLAVKPVESGCGADPESEDGRVLAEATGQREPREALLRLRAPLTPALAAEQEGAVVDVPALARSVRALAGGFDVVIVEGAGGLLSPLSWTHDVTHLARALGESARVLVVGGNRLGALNHVLLTVKGVLGAGLDAAGVVLSAPAEADASTPTNAAALRRTLGPYGLSERVLELPRARDCEEVARALRPVLSWFDAA